MNTILAQIQYDMVFASVVGISAVVLTGFLILFPFLLLGSLRAIRRELEALRMESSVQDALVVSQQKRTNELLEWLGTIQQPGSSP